MRYELPPDVDPQQEQAILAALEEYERFASVRPSPWALSGRAEGLSLGALQTRHQSLSPWTETRLNPYTRRGTETRMGRGDSK
jgi:hypothetical protein